MFKDSGKLHTIVQGTITIPKPVHEETVLYKEPAEINN